MLLSSLPPQGFYLFFCRHLGAEIFNNFLPHLIALPLAFDEIIIGSILYSLGSNKCHAFIVMPNYSNVKHLELKNELPAIAFACYTKCQGLQQRGKLRVFQKPIEVRYGLGRNDH